MISPVIECVPNVAEGRDERIIDALRSEITGTVPAVTLLHHASDPDHNRTVFTFAGVAEAVVEAGVRLAVKAVQLIDLRRHRGVHPRLGALDVLPFIPLEGASLGDCIAAAYLAGTRIWKEAALPAYFYEAAALVPSRRKLEDVRRGEFEGVQAAVLDEPARYPDVGGPALHPTAGAVIVGARQFLIAYNINLRSSDLSIAKAIARSIRTSSGGLPAVKALGLSLASRGLVQVSMNLTDFETTSILQVFEAVQQQATRHGVEIDGSELIGLVPRRALDAQTAQIIRLPDFGPHRIIEDQLQRLQSRDFL